MRSRTRVARYGWLILLVLVLLPGTAAAQAVATASSLDRAIEQIDALAAADFAKDGIGSLTMGVVVGPKLVWTKSYGFADMEAKKPATADSIYRIGSITKQFTALMLLQLMEQGKVRLTDPLEKHFSEARRIAPFAPGQAPITLAQVATMTSGLAREPDGPPDHSRGPVSGWEDKVLASVPFVKFAHEPGTRYLYSNIGYAMLGVALGRAASMPFTQYVSDRILKPLGMSHTAFDVTDTIRPALTRAYSIRNGKGDPSGPDAERAGRGYRVPNGALMSTVGDLAKFLAFELRQGPQGVLKKETQEFQHSGVLWANGNLTSAYGIGFQVTRRETLIALGHGGSTAGYRSSALVDRASGTGIIALASVEGGALNVGNLALRALAIMAEAYQPIPAPRPPRR